MAFGAVGVMPIDTTHDPALQCWVPGADGHRDFPIQNLPLGIFAPDGAVARGGVAIGDHILDLAALADSGLLAGAALHAARAASGTALNPLLALGSQPRIALRARLSTLLSDPTRQDAVAPMLRPMGNCSLDLPCAIGDYTDFYAGIHHATNAGRLFRPDEPLLPNYKYIPIGYHGRASSVRPSGAAVHRPNGQRRGTDGGPPQFGPSARLDYELELGIWISGENAPGDPIPIGAAPARIAGLCLLNDWSARDLQAWEYQPLGPFLAKSFCTTLSPWIVTAEALAPFRLPQPPRPPGDPPPLPYLWDDADQAGGAFAITLEVSLLTQRMRAAGLAPHRLSQGAATDLYWTAAQLVAHHASNGCNLRPGDLLGTGTISAPTPDGVGSLLEMAQGGRTPVTLPNGEQRAFLENGDTVDFSARAVAEDFVPIGFGPCRGTVAGAG